MTGDVQELRSQLAAEAAAQEKAKERMRLDFLLAVVNANDKSDSEAIRAYFLKRYSGWFPPLVEGQELERLQREELYEWFRLETNAEPGANRFSIPIEEFHPQLGLHVAILRYKLRAIWKVAQVKEESARRRVGHLLTDIRRHYRGPWGCTERYDDIWAAAEWLDKNVAKLRICKNPLCSSPFYIRAEKNQKYCCSACSDEGQTLRWKNRPKAPVKRALTPEGIRNISEAQQRRHAEAREAKRRKQKPFEAAERPDSGFAE